MKQYKLRVASSVDTPGIFRVMQDTQYIAAFFPGKSASEAQAALQELLFSDTSALTTVVVESECAIVGYSIFGPYDRYRKPIFDKESDKWAYSLGTGVLSEHRGRGLGKRLRRYADNIARVQGFMGMITDVANTNRASIKVQESCGYTRAKEYVDPAREPGKTSVVFKRRF